MPLNADANTLIIFDIDGTLLYSNAIDSQCYAATFNRIYGQALPSLDLSSFSHVNDTTIFQELIKAAFNRPVDPDELVHFQDEFVKLIQEKRQSNPEDFQPVPHSKEMVDRLLHDDNFIVGIATGGWERPASVKLAHVGIPKVAIIGSYADHKYTREAILEETIEKARKVHSNIQRIVYVGDAPWDVRTCKRMNIPLIGIRWKGDSVTLSRLGVSHVLDNYTDYQAFLNAVKSCQVPDEKKVEFE